MKEDAITQKIANELKAWLAAAKESQKGQTDFYEYEKTFVELWFKLGREVLQDGLGNGNYKKNIKKK
ncbi:hypothetical protein [Chondrinema litorale]|uniref:hypothetical protein n=1 Tax=Chondrinema litorale TaxID=2994555 RepID=UPI002542AC47|nr:hypothetical protein [Chondrinema litorale]UZR98548.1 hypothetical protein OQ292_31590 [Chondrinema litorale]